MAEENNSDNSRLSTPNFTNPSEEMEIQNYVPQYPENSHPYPYSISMANPPIQYVAEGGEANPENMILHRQIIVNVPSANYFPAGNILNFGQQMFALVENAFDNASYQPFASFYQKISQLIHLLYGVIERYRIMPGLTNNINISIGILRGLQAFLNNPIFISRESTLPFGILMDQKLQNMLTEQLFVSVGSEANRKNEYEKFLRDISASFMEISTQINDKLDQICAHIGNYAGIQNEVQWADPSYDELRRFTKELFEQLLIVTIQPVPMHLKIKEGIKSSIYDFTTEFGIFGTNIFILNNNEQNEKIESKLMEIDGQNDLESYEAEHFKIVSKIKNLQNGKMDINNIIFRRYKMRICGKVPNCRRMQSAKETNNQQQQQEGMQRRKACRRNTPLMQYFIRWSVHVLLKHGIELDKNVDTFPFMITTATNNIEHLDAQAFIERIFPSKMDTEDLYTTTNVMLKALEKKFQAVATKPPKECGEKEEIDEIANNRFNNTSSIESISVSSTSLPIMATSSTSSSNRSKDVAEMPAQRNVLIRYFIPILFQNLTVMIGANVPENGFVKIENYLQQVSLMTKLNGDAVPFNEWFLSLPKLICQKKLFCKLWNKGIIFYCCKKEAEELVTKNGPGTFMVRVSNTEFETFKITSLRRGKMEIEHYPCAFYGITEPLMLQMKQHHCHLNAPNIIKWSKNGTTKCVDFAKMLKKFDESEYKNLLEMRKKEYTPNDGKGFRANIDYQRNQKPFGTDSYLRQRWKLWKK